MKKYLLNSLLVISLSMLVIFTSCEDDSVDTPKFNVQIDSNHVLDVVGDTIVCKSNEALKFIINGNMDMLTFFSGYEGHEYQYRNRTKLDGTPSLSFQTTLTYGTQFDGLKVYLSSTFPGITRDFEVDKANVLNMSYWKDITALCNLPTSKTAPDNVTTSPQIDLSDYKDTDFYIAFRLVHPQGGECTWQFNNLKVVNKYKTTEGIVGTFSSIGLTAFDVNATSDHYLNDAGNTDKVNRRWDFGKLNTENQIKVGGSNGNTFDNDDWAISSTLDLMKTIPDKGEGIKAFSDVPLTDYYYNYSTPGVYTVTFLGINSNNKASKEKVQSIVLKVVD